MMLQKIGVFFVLGVSYVNGLANDALPRRAFFKTGAAGVAFLACTCPENVFAYERRDVGGNDRSALTTAMNDQAFKTNSRLEASGFKLDTREEEDARLSSALSSFSYESSTPKKKTGYQSAGSKKQPEKK